MMETDCDNVEENETNSKADLLFEIQQNLPNEVLSVQTENSCIAAASEYLDQFKKPQTSNSGANLEVATANNDNESQRAAENEEKRDFFQKQVQSGEITPFQAINKEYRSQKIQGVFNKTSQLLDLEKYLMQQSELAKQKKTLVKTSVGKRKQGKATVSIPAKKQRLKKSDLKNITPHSASVSNNNSNYFKSNIKLRKSKEKHENAAKTLTESEIINTTSSHTTNSSVVSSHDRIKDISTKRAHLNQVNDSDSEYIPSDELEDSDEDKLVQLKKRVPRATSSFFRSHCTRILDDGDEDIYHQRVEECHLAKNQAFHKIDNLFKVPQSIWKRLYRYQKVSVQWLWELHGRDLGGLLGDEMGLGKTVQVIAFLAGLDFSELLSDGERFRGLGPTLILCPATLMEQWVKHFHEWWPIIRVAVLHHSGTYSGDLEYLLHSLKPGGILVTSYSSILRHKDLLVNFQWHYVILDEGHKIRNPEAKVSKIVKKFSTPHRLLLTGSPMQNSLKELWSLFDFILPGKLGTLPAFLEHCANPITRGGYANASALQEATALQVATMLKDAITPYMLRRTKNDVQHHVCLPEKNEQVLFCCLTDEQKKLYKEYLRSDDVSFVLRDKNNSQEGLRYKARLFVALSALRKLCNHPDLYLYSRDADSDEELNAMDEESLKKFGFWKRAGKMVVVRSLLKIWKKQGHRVLLFTQGRQMLHVLEALLQNESYSYLRLDGSTVMSQRQQIIKNFNSDPSYFIFLLTTRVGGLGVNLTGADRVIIYDPDWNPATDVQARERAWRIGQDKKIYHRQIFKLLLSNRVLEDPRQRRIFKTSDLVELFNLNEPIHGNLTESDRLFHDSKLELTKSKFSSTKVDQMRKLASKLSKCVSNNAGNTLNENSEKRIVKITKELPKSEKPMNIKETMHINNSSISNSVVKNEDINSSNSNEELKTDAVFDDTNNQAVLSQNIENQIPDIENDNTKSTLNIINQNSNDSKELEETDTIMEVNPNLTDKLNEPMSEEDESKIRKTYRKHKHSKHRRKNLDEKEISGIFEGERISFLIGRRLGNSQERESTPTTDDQYVLSKLFSKSAVSSALQHDKILLNATQNSCSATPMQRLARENAQEKMDCIRQSRKWCWRPTWEKFTDDNE
ncbi:DNA excision repair protein ERCC-6-like isoform X3 [Prorops nasuta]|uniref:DNA excision repair protein ERCC-6-like isoform X3 n=1 Tax=Prorops nasuta TaxID=863751 RepID=UPI0034CF1045